MFYFVFSMYARGQLIKDHDVAQPLIGLNKTSESDIGVNSERSKK